VIVAHLSDLHLGFRAYGRVEGGADVRERDVAAAFERASQEIVRIRPDVIVIAGDVFDRPDPPAGAVVSLARGLEAFRASLPDAPVLMVAGPRDTPRREGDPGALAVFDSFPNVQAATGLPRSILIERLGLHAVLLPHRSVTRSVPAMPEPDPRLQWNLLVLHAEPSVKGGVGVHVAPGEWSYVALGGEHRRRKVTARAQYSGSLERVALDPWAEAADEKGFLTVDLRTGRVSFHSVPGRPVVALAPVKVGRGEPDRVRRRVREVIAEVPGGITGKIVRLRLEGAAPSDLLALQGEPLRELRGKALHLAVEAGKELKVPAEAWLPIEVQRQLREAAAAELEREGRLDERAEAVLSRCISTRGLSGGAPAAPITYGAIEALDGDVPGLGRVSTSIPTGLTALVGGGGRGRRAVLDLLAAASGAAGGALAALWRGGEPETLEGALRGAVEAVAESRGLSVLRAALAELGRPPSHTVPARAVEPVASPRTGGAVRVDPEQVAAEFRAAERELRASRADVAEVDGDMEVATMDWLRERQDAETTLLAYRDRARELRTRIRDLEAAGPEAPCPTCGRVLEGHHHEVLRQLRDQFESVVQDGSWWRSRWEQLEPKPAALQELEGRSLRLHAALEAGSERVELLRARLQDLDRPARVAPAPATDAEGAVIAVLDRLHAARLARAGDLVVERASRFVCRISGSRILGLTREGERVRLEGGEGALSPMSEEELATAKVAIRLGGASLVAAAGRVLGSIALEEPFDRLDEETQTRTLLLVRELLGEIPRVILFTRGDVVDARPELFDYVLEVREEVVGGGPPLRPALAGPGHVTFEVPVERKTTRVG
jgi:DNA repair exonuclease SbcCD nuclease subunit